MKRYRSQHSKQVEEDNNGGRSVRSAEQRKRVGDKSASKTRSKGPSWSGAAQGAQRPTCGYTTGQCRRKNRYREAAFQGEKKVTKGKTENT